MASKRQNGFVPVICATVCLMLMALVRTDGAGGQIPAEVSGLQGKTLPTGDWMLRQGADGSLWGNFIGTAQAAEATEEVPDWAKDPPPPAAADDFFGPPIAGARPPGNANQGGNQTPTFTRDTPAGSLDDADEAEKRGDYATEFMILKPLADAGDAGAQWRLGWMYAHGEGLLQNYAEAVKWYRLAAAQGDAGAQLNLGFMYLHGQGVPQNYSEAIRWCRLAAAQGNPIAQFNLGLTYDEGKGVPRNYAEAVKWYRLAAEQDDAGAQLNLGVKYEHGQGVPQNYSEAVKWYRLAAAQGNAIAQFNLGLMYAEGKGVPQDYVQAHMWFNLSAANGESSEDRSDATRNRDVVAGGMTPAQIAEAQQLARQWKPTVPRQEAAASQPPPQSPTTGQILSGSGFFVSGNGEVLTNAHVVEGCRTAEVTGQGAIVPSAQAAEPERPPWETRALTAAPPLSPNEPAMARIIARDAEIDLALLKVPQRPPAVAQLRLTAQQGENVFAYGFPLPGLLSSGGNFTSGTVTALAGIQDDSRSLQISAPVQPGSSGGPLLDEAGKVVGVVVAKLDALKVARVTEDMPQNVNFAIKATVAADFLGAHGVRYAEGNPGPPLAPSAIAERARAFTVRVECEQSARP